MTEFTKEEILFLICGVCSLSLLGEGEDNRLICDWVTEKLMSYNFEHHAVAIPDRQTPLAEIPEDIQERILKATKVYNEQVVAHILEWLKNHPNDDNMKED